MLTQCHTLPEMLFPFLPACKISLFGLFFSQSMFFCRCFFESIKDLYIQASGPTLCLEVEVMRRRQIVISYLSTTHCNTLQHTVTHNTQRLHNTLHQCSVCNNTICLSLSTHCNSCAQYVTTLVVLSTHCNVNALNVTALVVFATYSFQDSHKNT